MALAFQGRVEYMDCIGSITVRSADDRNSGDNTMAKKSKKKAKKS